MCAKFETDAYECLIIVIVVVVVVVINFLLTAYSNYTRESCIVSEVVISLVR